MSSLVYAGNTTITSSYINVSTIYADYVNSSITFNQNSVFVLNASALWFNGLFGWYVNDNSIGYLAFNGSYISFNETKLNTTIDNRIINDGTGGWINNSINTSTTLNVVTTGNVTASYFHGTIPIKQETINVVVLGGEGSNITTCCTSAEIIQVKVTPPTALTTFRSSSRTVLSNESVDTNRITHTGNWTIAHRGTTVTSDTINHTITSASDDGTYLVRIRYK